MGEVVELGCLTKLDIPVEKILAGAAEAGLTEVVVCGFLESGEFYFASSLASGPETLWSLRMAEKKLLEIGDPDG